MVIISVLILESNNSVGAITSVSTLESSSDVGVIISVLILESIIGMLKFSIDGEVIIFV